MLSSSSDDHHFPSLRADKELVKRLARRIGIALVGGIVLLIGIALIVLPGPAILVIPFGLTILALEFEWARESLRKFRAMLPFRKKSAAVPKP